MALKTASSAFSWQDVGAFLVSLVCAVGVVGLAILDKQIPSDLSLAFGASLGWLFTRSGHVAGLTENPRIDGPPSRNP